MDVIADVFLIGGALAAAVYCVVLSRRLRRFTDLEKGVGGAIAVLSAQVDDMTKTLSSAQISAIESAQTLDRLTTKAENVARRLELLVASMHDIPEFPGQVQANDAAVAALQPSAPANDPPAIKTSEKSPQTALDVPTPDADTSPLFLSTRNRVSEAAE